MIDKVAIPHSGAAIFRRLIKLRRRDAIAAALLAGVKLAIGFRHPQLGGQVGMATGTGDADADGDEGTDLRLGMGNVERLDLQPDFLRNQFCPLGVRAGQDAGELLAAIARRQVGRALDRAGQCGADHRDAAIPGGMAIGVVELLEEIDVKHDDRHPFPGPGQARAFRLQRPFHVATIAQAR